MEKNYVSISHIKIKFYERSEGFWHNTNKFCLKKFCSIQIRMIPNSCGVKSTPFKIKSIFNYRLSVKF